MVRLGGFREVAYSRSGRGRRTGGRRRSPVRASRVLRTGRRTARAGRSRAGRVQAVRIELVTGPQQGVVPMALPGQAQLVMPGAPRPRKARF